MTDLVDFHSHFPTPNAIVCTAFPPIGDVSQQDTSSKERTLMYFEGLLPQYWSIERWEVLKTCLLEPGIHLGEVGLDRRFTGDVSLDQQFENLITMLQYARSLHKKVTIHSVQATELTIRAIKEASLPSFSVLWHGFTGSKETARQLYDSGVLIGIGPRLLGFLKPTMKVRMKTSIMKSYRRAMRQRQKGWAWFWTK